VRVFIEALTDALGGTGMIRVESPRETTRRDTEWSIAVVLKTTSLDAASRLGHQG
jgi:hypothetical protein